MIPTWAAALLVSWLVCAVFIGRFIRAGAREMPPAPGDHPSPGEVPAPGPDKEAQP